MCVWYELIIYILCIYIYILRTYVYTYIHTYIHAHSYIYGIHGLLGGWMEEQSMDGLGYACFGV